MVIGNLIDLNVQEIEKILSDCNTVIFAAGASSQSNEIAYQVDYHAVVKTTDAAEKIGVEKYLLISASPDAWRDQHMSANFEYYMSLKKKADIYLSHSSLNWLIIRPGTLTMQKENGKVNIGGAIPYDDISRANLASSMIRIMESHFQRCILEITDGDTAIDQAISALR